MRCFAAILTLLAVLPLGAAAEDFYAGKTVRLVIGSESGASYDSYARIVARHLPRHIPGGPSVVVQNMPAAGGLVAAAHLYNIAEKDGTVIGMVNRYAALAPIVGNPQARYRSEEFGWLGTAASFSDNAYLLIIRAALPYRTVEDLKRADPPLHIGASGSDMPAVLKQVLGLKFNLIEGYGKSDLDIAFERGEVDGETFAYANLLARRPDWLEKRLARIMVQFGRRDRLPALAEVPTARELVRTEEDQALIELTEAPLLMAYPFAMPPGVPAARAAILSKAFDETFADPAYAKEVVQRKLDNTPLGGATVQELVARMAKIPPAVIERYKSIVGNKTGG